VEGVKEINHLATWLGVDRGRLKYVVEQFLEGRGHYQPSWRVLIFALDGAGETRLAGNIKSCGEPVQGVCVCVCVCVKHVCVCVCVFVCSSNNQVAKDVVWLKIYSLSVIFL
jgi:hypothetical protein